MARRKRKLFVPREVEIQAACLEHWLALGLPNTLVAAIPNAFAHGQPGLTRGLPDLLVLGPRVPSGVGFIELKRDAASPISAEQLAFGDLCFKLYIAHAICVGRDEPIRQLERWGVVKAQARAA